MPVSLAPTLTLPASLSEAEARAVRKFQDRLEQAMPGQVERLILFGSKARGDVRPDSDVDVFLVLREVTPERRDQVRDFTVDLRLEDEVDLTAIVFDREDLQYQAEIGTPLIRNLAMQGVPLIGERITMGKGKPDEVARAFLQASHHRLNATRLLVEGGEWRDAVSRAYYAVLDAADGALAAIRITPKSHAGTLVLFSSHLIKPGRVDSRYSAIMERIQKSRLEADYERLKEVTEADARAAQANAVDFAAMIEALVPDLLAEGASKPAEGESNGADTGDASQ